MEEPKTLFDYFSIEVIRESYCRAGIHSHKDLDIYIKIFNFALNDEHKYGKDEIINSMEKVLEMYKIPARCTYENGEVIAKVKKPFEKRYKDDKEKFLQLLQNFVSLWFSTNPSRALENFEHLVDEVEKNSKLSFFKAVLEDDEIIDILEQEIFVLIKDLTYSNDKSTDRLKDCYFAHKILMVYENNHHEKHSLSADFEKRFQDVTHDSVVLFESLLSARVSTFELVMRYLDLVKTNLVKYGSKEVTLYMGLDRIAYIYSKKAFILISIKKIEKLYEVEGIRGLLLELDRLELDKPEYHKYTKDLMKIVDKKIISLCKKAPETI